MSRALYQGTQPKPIPRVNERYCKGCNLCVWLCPPRALRLSETFSPSGYRVPELVGVCTGCLVCEVICPDFAIWIVNER